MATSLSRNLKLRIDSNLTANAKYNLARIDDLGGTFIIDNTETVNIRSKVDINLRPEDASVGGSGSGGTITLGVDGQDLDELNIFALRVNLDEVDFRDQAPGGTKSLILTYQSDLTGSVDTTADRQLAIDLEGGDRALILSGDYKQLGGFDLTLNLTADSSLIMPITGTLATLAGMETLTNKTIDADLNTLSNIENADIKAAAGIVYSKLSLTNGIVNADINSSAAIAYSKLNLSASIINSDVNPAAAIVYSKLSLNNSILNSDINTSAGIAYSKLDLSSSIVNNDISSGANISGSKINADFGSQEIKTSYLFTLDNGSNTTSIGYASSGQVDDLLFKLPPDQGAGGQVLSNDGVGNLSWVSVGGTGTVTSVALAAPAEFSVSGSPIVGAGTLTLTKASQLQNLVWASPNGSSGQPSFRSLVSNDIPSLLSTKISDFDEAAQDAVGTILLDTASVDLSYNDGTPSISATVLPAGVNHDALMNFVANKHIDHTSVTISGAANGGLSGGGDISASRTLSVDPTNATSATVASGDLFLFADISAANALKQGTISDIVALVPITPNANYKTDWTSGTSFNANHLLGSRDVMVQLYDNTTYETIEVDSTIRTDSNNVDFTSSTAPTGAGWRVLISKVG